MSYQARSAEAVAAAQQLLEAEAAAAADRAEWFAAAGAARGAAAGSKPNWEEWVGGRHAARIKALKVRIFY